MGRQLVTVRTFDQDFSVEGASAAANLTLTDTLHTPGWAKYATFFLNLTAMSGSGETVDWKLSYVNPVNKSTATDYPGSGITQITAAGQVIIHVTPEVADDDTGPIYYLNSPLPATLKTTTVLGSTSVAAVHTLDLGDIGTGDTYKLTYDSTECAALVTYASDSTTAIQAKCDEIMGGVHSVVTRTDANTYVITYNHGFTPASTVTVTTITGFTPKGDAGYTAGGIETTPVTLGDEVYAGTLSVVYAS